MKLVTFLMALTLVFGLGGCTERKIKKTVRSINSDSSIDIFCDTEKGVEYLILDRYRVGGITVRHDRDGMVSNCGTKDIK